MSEKLLFEAYSKKADKNEKIGYAEIIKTGEKLKQKEMAEIEAATKRELDDLKYTVLKEVNVRAANQSRDIIGESAEIPGSVKNLLESFGAMTNGLSETDLLILALQTIGQSIADNEANPSLQKLKSLCNECASGNFGEKEFLALIQYQKLGGTYNTLKSEIYGGRFDADGVA